MGIDNLKGTGTENGVVKASYNPPNLPGFAGQYGMGGCVANAGGGMMPGTGMPMNKRTEVRFVGPNGMKISWYVPSADGKGAFSPSFLTAPARYNFLQGALYRLKLSDIANRPGLELYPTLEVVPSGPRSDAFLAHSAVPITFTDEDLDQVATGNFVVKVIYLPEPQYQDLATVGPDEVVSSRWNRVWIRWPRLIAAAISCSSFAWAISTWKRRTRLPWTPQSAAPKRL